MLLYLITKCNRARLPDGAMVSSTDSLTTSNTVRTAAGNGGPERYLRLRQRATKVEMMMTRKMTRNVRMNLAIRASGCAGPKS